MVYNWLDTIRNGLFPPQCRLCLAPGTRGQDLCEGCRKELPWLGKTCQTCALPLSGEVTDHCSSCLNSPPVLDACHALFAYQPPIDNWIHALKFQQDLAIAQLLGQLLINHPAIAKHADKPGEPLINSSYRRMPVSKAWNTLDPGMRRDDEKRVNQRLPGLLPVPLHRKRLAQRGYNQAHELARPLLVAGYPPAHCDCRRVRHTEAQSTLDRNERSRNLRGIFNVTSPSKEQRILLIDDVMTTGATLNELASELKRAGVSWVGAVVVARTLKGLSS